MDDLAAYNLDFKHRSQAVWPKNSCVFPVFTKAEKED
jgi:hypothetical protein